ncbi:MAG: SDR family NAD(P)-dependent oxidoreductase [Verrucomicrobiota bacterium]
MYEDAELRIPGSPVIAPDTWKSVLEEEGFEAVQFPVETMHRLGQQIVTARSNGVVRRRPTVSEPVKKEERIVAPVGLAATDAQVVDALMQALADTLKMPRQEIDRDAAFSDYGMDSILSAGFIEQAGEALGISLNAAIIFDYTTVNRLSAYIQDHNAPKPAAVSRSPVAEPDGLAIAVIGMSGQFPGAKDVETFWQNLKTERDGIDELPPAYLDQERYFSPELEPGKTYCKWGGILEDRACFDPLFFSISPREAESMNPHQRLILEEGWKSLEDAGYNPKALTDVDVGLFIGAEPTGYSHESFTGASDAIVASRLSYVLNLTGPSLVINTGCSSSATAIHLACEHLRASETRMALAGGVSATMNQSMLVTLSQIEMLAPGGRCRTFDASADGTVFSEGVGLVVLKRLEDAEADGDTIYGIIKASGMNQDGASNGITAPNGLAQEKLIAGVYRRYAIDPEAISYIEAHGTGTRLGDPVEANALVRAFRRFTDKQNFCAVGSAKAHVGHLGACSGVAGLIKVLMSFRDRHLPRLLHFETLNPLIEFAGSAFHVNTESRAWRSADDRPLMAGLNSFGHSGTNVHIVVEQYVADHPVSPTVEKPVLIPLSARSEERLKEVARRLVAALKTADLDLQRAAYTLQVGRAAMEERVIFIVGSRDELLEKLSAVIEGKDIPDGYRGRVYGDETRIQLLAGDEDTLEMMSKWVTKGKLNKVAQCWAEGIEVDWSLLYGEHVPRRIRVPAYPFAREPYWMDARSEPEAPIPEKTVAEEEPVRPMTFEEVWQEEERSAPAPAEIKTLVCFLSRKKNQAALTEVLKTLSPETRLIFVGYGRKEITRTEEGYRIGKNDSTAYHEVFQQIRDDVDAVDAVLYLWPLDDPGTIKDFAPLVQLLQAMAATGLHPHRLISAGSFDNALDGCYLDAMIGFGRSLARLLPDIRMAVVAREGAAEIESWAELLWAELSAESMESALYRDGQRFVKHRQPLPLEEAEVCPLKQDGTYLITGGCGGLGLLFAEYLVRGFNARLILTGRSALTPEKQERLDAIGGVYLQVDVSDAKAMKKALEPMAPIHGVFHAAGIEGSRTLFENSIEEFERVLAPKIKGALALDEALRDAPLDFVCYFSSSAALLGDFGSCDYAVANRFLTAYAAVRPGRALAINWPVWKDGGMSAGDEEQTRLYLASSGQRALETEEGIAAFEQLLVSASTHGLVLAGKPSRMHQLLGPAEAEPGLNVEAFVESDLKDWAGRLLKIDRDLLDTETNLVDYGFDSISLAEFARALSKHFGINIVPSLFFGHSTLGKFKDYLMTRETDLGHLVVTESGGIGNDAGHQGGKVAVLHLAPWPDMAELLKKAGLVIHVVQQIRDMRLRHTGKERIVHFFFFVGVFDDPADLAIFGFQYH